MFFIVAVTYNTVF